jgi:speckle-type POZ protein
MSPATAVEPLRSASSIIADTTKGYHVLKIDGYSFTKNTPNGQSLRSHPFTLGGHLSSIRYYPNGDGSETKDYISLFLNLDPSATKAVKAWFQFRFVDDVDEKPLALERVNIFANNSSWGYLKFVKREYFEKSKHLKEDSFSVRCDNVVANGFHAEVAPPAFVSVPPSNLHQHLGDLLRSEKGADVV